jgi:beta-lactamase class A
VVASFIAAVFVAFAAPGEAADQIAALERSAGGRIGVVALDTANGQRIAHRPNERFAMCSTFKFLAAAAILKATDDGKESLDRFVPYTEKDLLAYAPVTKRHVKAGGMKLGDLCAAALQQSDNTAGNLLLRALGGPAGLTKFARTLGDEATRLDRMEPELNTALPGDERDTTTPAAMCEDLRRLLVSDVLSSASRRQLESWLIGNTTGEAMIRSGVPKNWRVGDKTGRGANGATNDIAVLHPPGKKPIFVAIYTVGSSASEEARLATVAQVARIVTKAFRPNE